MSFIFTIVRQQVRVYELAQVKREGDAISSKVETMIKNDAVTIYTSKDRTDRVCYDDSDEIDDDLNASYHTSDTGTDFVFFNKEDVGFKFFWEDLDGLEITREDSVLWFDSDVSDPSNKVSLTSDKVYVSYITIECKKTDSLSLPVVNIKYSVGYKSSSGVHRELPYSLTVKLRNE